MCVVHVSKCVAAPGLEPSLMQGRTHAPNQLTVSLAAQASSESELLVWGPGREAPGIPV